MSKILLIETSSKNCSVALGINGVAEKCLEISSEDYVHAEKLHILIDELLLQCSTKLSELDAVCVSKGPGSYTGLRIGVSAAKGFCYGLNIQLIALETTLILAAHAKEKFPSAKQFLPMIDARRMEVYCALYDTLLNTLEPVSAQVVDDLFFQKEHLEQTILVGDGVEKCIEFIPHASNMLPALPSASMMAKLAQESFDKSLFEDVAYFEPFYLKDFIAGIAKKVF